MKCLKNRNWKHIKVKRNAEASITWDASGISETTGTEQDYILSWGSTNRALSTWLPIEESTPCCKWVPSPSVQGQREGEAEGKI